MKRPELEITICPQGRVTVQISGAKGPRCLKFADLLVELVGREERRQLTREYYEPDDEVRVDLDVRERGG